MSYAFQKKNTAQTLKTFAECNPTTDFQENEGYNTTAGAVVNVGLTTDEVEGSGEVYDDEDELTLAEGEAAKLRKLSDDETLKPYEWSEGSQSVQTFNSLEVTPMPEGARVVTLNDSFNRRFGFQVEPSEVFGVMEDDWTGTDRESAVNITLDTGFKVYDSSTLQAFPAPTLPESLDQGEAVTCRFNKALGKWFFFKPSGGTDCLTLTVSGNPLEVSAFDQVPAPVTAFYSQLAANESVGGTLIAAFGQRQPITGSEGSKPWIQFPTSLTTSDETPLYLRQGSNALANLYLWKESNSSWHIALAENYGKVIRCGSGSGSYLKPVYRLVNGQRFWGVEGGAAVYYAYKVGTGWGWTYSASGSRIGKDLLPSDVQPFATDLTTLMSSAGLTYEKPQWNSTSKLGLYSPANGASGTLQVGCRRFTCSDGRTLATPFTFTHVCDGSEYKWVGKYQSEAVGEAFSGIQLREDPETEEEYYSLGNVNGLMGFYRSETAPAASGSVTFNYCEGSRGLYASLRYARTENGTEYWTLKCGREVVTYQRVEGSETFTGSFRSNLFGNITHTGNVWIIAGSTASVGSMRYTGSLSTTDENHFTFTHSVTLQFLDWVEGSEKMKVYICSPGNLS